MPMKEQKNFRSVMSGEDAVVGKGSSSDSPCGLPTTMGQPWPVTKSITTLCI